MNICTLLSGYLALWKLLDKREMPNRFLWNCAKWGYVLLAAFLQALVSQLHIPWLNLVTIAISFVGMTKLFFRCNLVPLLLYDTAVMVCLFAADMVSSLAVSVSLGDSVSETLQRTDVLLARYLLCIILCFMLCSIFPLFFKRRELYEIYWYEVIAYGLLAAFEITSAAYIVHRLQFFSSGLFVILFTMGCLVLDIYLVFVFYQLAESRKREKEYSLIQQQSNIQLSVYRELSQKYATPSELPTMPRNTSVRWKILCRANRRASTGTHRAELNSITRRSTRESAVFRPHQPCALSFGAQRHPAGSAAP